tara:strand:- start:2861 stop:3541 length:681 start_codon:yes stop_codon:yes gene_type:complete
MKKSMIVILAALGLSLSAVAGQVSDMDPDDGSTAVNTERSVNLTLSVEAAKTMDLYAESAAFANAVGDAMDDSVTITPNGCADFSLPGWTNCTPQAQETDGTTSFTVETEVKVAVILTGSSSANADIRLEHNVIEDAANVTGNMGLAAALSDDKGGASSDGVGVATDGAIADLHMGTPDLDPQVAIDETKTNAETLTLTAKIPFSGPEASHSGLTYTTDIIATYDE